MSPLPVGRDQTVDLLRRMSALGAEDGLRASLREAVIRDHMRYAWYITTLYNSRRGEQGEDDVQLAYRSLGTAVDVFDPECGVSFLSHAVPMILREVKASRRDTAGDLGASPRTRQVADALCVSAEQLTQELGRSPSVPELAAAMGESCEDVVESLDAALGSAMAWIDLPEPAPGNATGSSRLGARRTKPSPEAITIVFALLENRAKRILLMQFLRKMSQAQIAAELGVHPEQVARLQDQSLDRLNAARVNPFSALTDTPQNESALADRSHETTTQPMHSGPGLLTA